MRLRRFQVYSKCGWERGLENGGLMDLLVGHVLYRNLKTFLIFYIKLDSPIS